MIEKTNTLKVLAYFFDHPTTPIHLRELARKTKISLPTVLSIVARLKKENLLTVTKSKVLTSIHANLEEKKFTRYKRLHNLQECYESGLVEHLIQARPQAIVCFGSYARGEDTERSDIDIALIKGVKKEFDLTRFEQLLKRRVSLHTIDPERISTELSANIHNGIILEGAF